jgi:hypothetical protein
VECRGLPPCQGADCTSDWTFVCEPQQIWACVPVDDCQTYGCWEGEECLPVTTCSSICDGGGQGTGAGNRAPCSAEDECVTSYQCSSTDECALLTEDDCMLDYDLCSANYETVCPVCDSDVCPCSQQYAGCVSVGP